MGCDIHIITQVRRNGAWEYVPEIPETLNTRDYSVFAALAGVRDSFNGCVFEPKGYPEDILDKKFQFHSETEYARNRYQTGTTRMCVCPDGTYVEPFDTRLKETLSEERYKELKEYRESDPGTFGSRYHGLGTMYNGKEISYHVFCADHMGSSAYFFDVRYLDLYPTLEEYLKEMHSSEWDELAQDYGYWGFDPECSDFHTPSWLTLKELQEADYAPYTANKAKVPREFFDAFAEFGGKLPEQFAVESSAVGDIRDCFQEAFCPTVTIVWQPSEKKLKQLRDELPLFIGIRELEEIAEKYAAAPKDIRIVFAFDN